MSLSNYKDYLFAGAAYLWSRYAVMSSAQSAANLTAIEPRTQLSPIVYRVLGCNPGAFTLQGTNTYLIGSGNDKLLIDTGEPKRPAYIESLKAALGANGRISSIVCTHWHHDHTGGIDDIIAQVIGNSVPVYKFKHDGDKRADFRYVDDGHTFRVDGATLRAVHTPGHTVDHMALVLDEENAIFSGDCVLGEGTTVFEDLHTYMASLEKLLQLAPTRIYPGHGPVIDDPMVRIRDYITHRNKRESEIMQFLQSHQSSPSSTMDIVNGVYVGISLAVKLGAANNVKHHLSKLLKQGRVVQIGGGDSWQATTTTTSGGNRL